MLPTMGKVLDLNRGLALLTPYCWLCGLAFLLAAIVPANSAPTVFWASDPILAGQTALLFGAGLGKDTTATGARVPDQAVQGPGQPADFTGDLQSLTVLQASDLSAKVLLPVGWKPGLYAVRLNAGRGQTGTIYLNRAEAWWWLGGSADATRAASGDVALSGDVIRVFGKNFGPQTRAWLTLRQQAFALQTVKAEKYTATFHLPADLAPGEYSLWVHNGYGGAYGFGQPLKIKVGKPEAWPANQYNVRAYGAKGDYTADDTAAFLTAIAQAQQHGGGIVMVPAGRYKITAKLSLPPHTILRGENRDRVWLYVPKNQPEFDTVIAGNSDFAVEDLTIVAQTVHRLIVCPDDPNMAHLERGVARSRGGNVHLTHLRLQHLRYAHRVPKNDPRRDEAQGPDTVSLVGPDMWLNDVQIVSPGMPFDIHEARRCRIENCVIGTGRNGYYSLMDFEEGVFEGNDIHAVDLEGTYGSVQHNANHLYFADNNWHGAYGGEREALTFDAPYYSAWMGTPGNAHGDTFTAPGQPWAPDSLRDQACLIVSGKGLGQFIPIVGNTADSITLERPWVVEPDQTSVISVQSNRTQVVVYNNRMSDASVACVLYSQCYGFIMDSNESQRTAGLYGNGWDGYDEKRQQRRYSCCYFNQWLNNKVSQAFSYDQGGFATGKIGAQVDQGGLDQPLNPPHVVMALGNIMRGNQAQDQTTIGVSFMRQLASTKKLDLAYVGRDTVIEDNTITDADVAIEVARYYIDTLIRNNQFQRCKTAISDHGTGTVIRTSDER